MASVMFSKASAENALGRKDLSMYSPVVSVVCSSEDRQHKDNMVVGKSKGKIHSPMLCLK